MTEVGYKLLDNYPEEFEPLTLGSELAVGYDLRNAEEEPITLAPGEHHVFKCGIALQMPESIEAQIRPRSGLSNKKHLIIPNAPGTIDPDYTGEIMVGLFNIGSTEQYIVRGERIAQIVFSKVERPALFKTTSLEETERGSGGFGSSGSL